MNPKIAYIYMNIVEELKSAKALNNLDVDLISIAADSIYRLGVARRNLDEQGEVIADFNGKLMKSSWVQITKDYQAIFHAGVRKLGLSPLSRAKLAIGVAASELTIGGVLYLLNMALGYGSAELPAPQAKLLLKVLWMETYLGTW